MNIRCYLGHPHLIMLGDFAFFEREIENVIRQGIYERHCNDWLMNVSAAC